MYAVTHQNHPVTKLFTGSLFLEFFGVSFNLFSSFKFALDGQGFPRIAIIGDVLDILSRVNFCSFYLQRNITILIHFVYINMYFFPFVDNIHVTLIIISKRMGSY